MTGSPADDWASRLDSARKEIAAALPPTPLIAGPGLGREVYLKLETFQPTGSFKVRGALAALYVLRNCGGVVTASTGNHALGVAWAAGGSASPPASSSRPAPRPPSSPPCNDCPATVIEHGHSYEDADQHARSLAGNGLSYLSGTSDPDVIAGQATIGFELLTQLPGACTVACGVGGGALASELA